MRVRILLGPLRFAFAAWIIGSLPAPVVAVLGTGRGQPVVLGACLAWSFALAGTLVVNRWLAARSVGQAAAAGVAALEAMLRLRTP